MIYLDVLAAVNLVMDYLLLTATARLAGVFVSRRRLLAGGAVGAAYAVAAVLPGTAFAAHPLAACAAGLGVVYAAFGRRPGAFLRLCLVFALVSCTCAGLVMALGQATGALLRVGGAYYLDVPLRVIVPAGLLCWCASGLLFRGAAGQNGSERPSAAVEIACGERRTRCLLLCDTGNALCEPVSGRPALVLDRRAAGRLVPPAVGAVLAGLRADNVPACMAALPADWRTRACLLPYRAVGQPSGLLLAFRPDGVWRDGHLLPGMLVAVSPTPVAGGRYEGLIGI